LSDRSRIPEDEIQICVSQLLAACAFGALVMKYPQRNIYANPSPLVGFLSDRASSRRTLYLLGLLALLCSTYMVAVARKYWILLTARLFQGGSSAVVWTVGLAVVADTLPTKQLGFAMGTIGSVVSLAMVSAPVLGGTIFNAFGYEAVFWVLGGLLSFDVILRLLMIERCDARKWGIVIDSDLEQEGDEHQMFPDNADKRSLRKTFLVGPCYLRAYC
jgi:MFS family permease